MVCLGLIGCGGGEPTATTTKSAGLFFDQPNVKSHPVLGTIRKGRWSPTSDEHLLVIFTNQIEATPDWWWMFYYRGNLYEWQGEYDKALEDMNHSKSFWDKGFPDYTEYEEDYYRREMTYLCLARLYERKEDYNTPFELFNQICRDLIQYIGEYERQLKLNPNESRERWLKKNLDMFGEKYKLYDKERDRYKMASLSKVVKNVPPSLLIAPPSHNSK